ncbi:MAG: aminotransferase class IV [Acidobacteriota bacterium]
MIESGKKTIYFFERGNPSPLGAALLPLSSNAVQYGMGLFETMRVYSSVVPFLDEHLERAERSMSILGLKCDLPREELKNTIYRSINESSIQEGSVKILFPVNDASFEISRYAVIVSGEIPYASDIHEQGGRAIILGWRKNSRSRLSGMKTFNYMENLLARMEANRKGFDEAILLNEKGNICEGAFSNLFFIKGKVIYTPSPGQGILSGITRGKVIRIASQSGFKIYEGKVAVSRIKDVHEAFMTSSLAEIISLVEIGKIRIGNGIPGEKTRTLHDLYRRAIHNEIMKINSTLRRQV